MLLMLCDVTEQDCVFDIFLLNLNCPFFPFSVETFVALRARFLLLFLILTSCVHTELYPGLIGSLWGAFGFVTLLNVNLKYVSLVMVIECQVGIL